MNSFKWRHFKKDIILMLTRWHLAYSLSYRDIEELALERERSKRPVGSSWRMDETYIKVKGKWVYLYRAVDKAGKRLISCYQKSVMNRLHGRFSKKLWARMARLIK
jgi:putative transposase